MSGPLEDASAALQLAPAAVVPARPVRQLILQALRTHGELTRAELAQRLSLPRTTVAEHVRVMLTRGQLEERAPSLSGRRGRPSGTLALPWRPGLVLVQVLSHGDGPANGPSTCAVVGVDGQVVGTRLVDAGADPLQGGIEAIGGLLREHGISRRDLRAAVVGVPFPLLLPSAALDEAVGTETEVIDDYAAVLGSKPQRRLSAAFGVPGLLGNDADLGALGLAATVPGGRTSDLAYVMCLRGMGMGLVRRGTLVTTGARTAGELRHVHAVDDAAPCLCGSTACSGGGWESVGLWDRLRQRGCRVRSLSELHAAVSAGDPATVRELEGYGASLGRDLSSSSHVFQPQVVVLEAALGPAFGPLATGLERGLLHGTPAWARQPVALRQARGPAPVEVLGAACAVGARLRPPSADVRGRATAAL